METFNSLPWKSKSILSQIQFVAVGNICSTRKCFSNKDLYFNCYNEKVLSREECSSTLLQKHKWKTLCLSPATPHGISSAEACLSARPQQVLTPSPPFLPAICPSQSSPDWNMTDKGILERNCSQTASFLSHNQSVLFAEPSQG